MRDGHQVRYIGIHSLEGKRLCKNYNNPKMFEFVGDSNMLPSLLTHQQFASVYQEKKTGNFYYFWFGDDGIQMIHEMLIEVIVSRSDGKIKFVDKFKHLEHEVK